MKIVLAVLSTFQVFVGVAISAEDECDPRYSGACVPVYTDRG
ncbi:hypothetical protein [Leptolyngbya ectocarpi]|nr:hypothetical protein [Leptolyngbya ectocarpi]